MADDWEIKPTLGLGALRFLMSPNAVSSFDDVYGAVTGRTNRTPANAVVEETLAMLASTLSPEQIASLRETMAK